ncbi:MAG: 2-C-methyl-D-erythritol 4-phosphate cytidylyltransferase [Firmicutes bacterium]|nr:2-C-methyl-D-erythritol 4-phosphate cytidylyltransferase [Bacillota bacterium]
MYLGGSAIAVSVIIPAAGYGKRMGSEINKQFLLLGGIPVVGRTVRIFAEMPEVAEIVLVVRSDELAFALETVVQAYGRGKTRAVAGGRTRQESVYHGLAALSAESEVVLIHDGARPLIEPGLVRQVIAAAEENGAAIAAVPVKDTIKVVENGWVSETLLRDKLWAVQTPQAFKREIILAAHQGAIGLEATDDAALVERLGYAVRVVPGSYKNIKITTPEDLLLAEAFLKEDNRDAGRNRI